MPNTELPVDLENQVMLMKKYVNFRQRKKMRDFLGYAGYFRASRYGKYLLAQVNVFGSKADTKVFFALYNFDVKLRLLLFKYCKKAEVYFKSAIANILKNQNRGLTGRKKRLNIKNKKWVFTVQCFHSSGLLVSFFIAKTS